jgi:hypothetical protein
MKVLKLIKLMQDELRNCGLEDADVKIIPKRELGFSDCFLDVEENVGVCSNTECLTIEFDAFEYDAIMEGSKHFTVR